METNVRKEIELFQSKQNELASIKNQLNKKRTDFEKKIEDERKHFEKSLDPMKENLNKISEEYNLMLENKISVKLEDLIKELSSLSGLDTEIKIDTNVGYWGKRSIKEIIQLMNESDQHLSCTGNYNNKNKYIITLFSGKKLPHYDYRQEFCYKLHFKLDLEELQADGKSLLEHCIAMVRYDDLQGLHYTNLVIAKNIYSLICHLSLNSLSSYISLDNLSINQNNDLLIQALINCDEKQNYNERQKKIKFRK